EQAHVPAEQPPTVEDPRLPAADAYPRGPGDPRRPSAQGSREPLRL
ncbi:MAG: LSU ribosomal protein L34p, partial [uncultured Blastococcus sp.]